MSITKRSDKGSALTYNEMDDNFDAIAPRDSATGAIQIPAGTSAEQPAAPATGMFRYNTSLNSFEGYSGGVWGAVGSGGAGGGQVNQNAFSEFIVSGQTNVSADTATDAVTIVAGTNMTITTDGGADSITFNAAFSQDFAYGSLTGAPTIPSDLTDLGITDGNSGQVLSTDGSGNFSFVAQTGGGLQGIQGTSGLQGALGTTLQGIQGTSGTPGTPGTPGADGDPGVQGPAGSVQGIQGTIGSGIQGISGADGDGNQGAQGLQGQAGSEAGPEGPPGEDGAQGFQGFQGPAGSMQGAQGVQGNDGPAGFGVQGIQGVDAEGAQGPQGPLGPAGFGAQGHQGVQGNDGPLGPPGAGAQGTQGTAGSTQGIQGIEGDGIQGSVGLQGPAGSTQGVQGNAGIGDDGVQGIQGISVQGLTGFGMQGIQGTDGLQGVIGLQGDVGTGDQGIQGEQGPQGVQGLTLQGLQGEEIQGTQGAQGAEGGEGQEGVQGVQGLEMQGAQGIQGTTFQGIQGPEGSFGQTGLQGLQGLEAQGVQGQRGEIGPSGGAQGVQGFNGIQGPSDGATGAQGTQGVSQAGPQGVQGNFGVQGDTGIQGPSNGPQGTQGTSGLQGLQGLDGTGAQGLQGFIGIQGPSDGATGADGADGTQGIQGLIGLQGPSDGATGAAGPQGVQGTTGEGVQGLQGTLGVRGFQGFQGLTGDGGAAGNNGLQGLQGLIGTGTLDNVVEDITPQLGGNLDLQSYYLGSASANISVNNSDVDITGGLDLQSNQIRNANGIGIISNASISSTSATYSNINVAVNINGSSVDLVKFGGDPVTPANPNLADTGTLFTDKVWVDANADQQFDLYDVVTDTADLTSDAGIYMNFKATTGLGGVQTRGSIWHQNNMLRFSSHDKGNANPQSNYLQLTLRPTIGSSALQLTSVVAGAATNYEVTTEYNAMTHIAQNMEYLSNPVRFNKIDTTARDALTSQAEGNMIYNTTTDQVEIYNGSGWENLITSVTGSVEITTPATTPALKTNADAGYSLFDGATNSAGARITISGGTEALGVNVWGFNAARNDYTPLNYGASKHIFKIGSTEHVAIDDDGLKFNGDTAAANALDDAETGTWTPSIAGDATYTARTGQYVKVGRMVTASFDMTINAINTSAAGSDIQGLPFAAGGSSQGQAGSVSYWSNAASSIYYVAIRVDLTATSLGLSFTTSATSTAQLGLSFWQNGARIIGTITYVTA